VGGEHKVVVRVGLEIVTGRQIPLSA